MLPDVSFGLVIERDAGRADALDVVRFSGPECVSSAYVALAGSVFFGLGLCWAVACPSSAAEGVCWKPVAADCGRSRPVAADCGRSRPVAADCGRGGLPSRLDRTGALGGRVGLTFAAPGFRAPALGAPGGLRGGLLALSLAWLAGVGPLSSHFMIGRISPRVMCRTRSSGSAGHMCIGFSIAAAEGAYARFGWNSGSAAAARKTRESSEYPDSRTRRR